MGHFWSQEEQGALKINNLKTLRMYEYDPTASIKAAPLFAKGERGVTGQISLQLVWLKWSAS